MRDCGGQFPQSTHFVCCFQYEDDARNFYESLKERLANFGLELSEDKSQIIKFGRFAGGVAGTFDFLGFTVISGKNRSGNYCVKYRTSEKKLKAKRANVKKWLWQNMHTPIGELVKKLNETLRGQPLITPGHTNTTPKAEW